MWNQGPDPQKTIKNQSHINTKFRSECSIVFSSILDCSSLHFDSQIRPLSSKNPSKDPPKASKIPPKHQKPWSRLTEPSWTPVASPLASPSHHPSLHIPFFQPYKKQHPIYNTICWGFCIDFVSFFHQWSIQFSINFPNLRIWGLYMKNQYEIKVQTLKNRSKIDEKASSESTDAFCSLFDRFCLDVYRHCGAVWPPRAFQKRVQY